MSLAPSKTPAGRFFEDFRLGQTLRHATPRTLNAGDGSLYSALYGSRFAVQSAQTFARAIGYPAAPIDDLLAFHVVFGKTVPDISLNAIANLGYADGRFLKAVYPGDTLTAASGVIGVKENSNRQSGVVWVRTRGFNQRGEAVVEYVRWVMVRKRDAEAAAPPAQIPDLPAAVAPHDLGAACPPLDVAAYDFALAGSPHRWGDYAAGERIDHIDGVTVEEAEHQIATRLYQNTAKVHFNQFSEAQGRFGRRLIYGGHVISLARALSFNGLANAFHVAAINGGRHVAPLFAGDTVFAWSEILDTAVLPGRDDVGALRVRLVATKNRPCDDFPLREGEGYEPSVVLDFDVWLLAAALRPTMRLPSDAALLVIDVQMAVDDPKWGPRNNPGAEAAIAALLAVWRAEGLPIFHIRHDSEEPGSPYRPDSPGHVFKPEAAPLPGEPVTVKRTHSAFVDTDLEAALDAIGATTLVVCGALTQNSVEATVRAAADIGYRVFLVGDACWAVDVRDLAGKLWPAEEVHALSLANLHGEYAEVVNSETALEAGRRAKARQRWAARRGA